MARFINVSIFILLAIVTSAMGKLVFPQNKLFQLTFIMLITFHPMLSFVAGGVNSDNIFNLFGALIIYLNLRLVYFEWRLQEIFLSLLVIWAASMTKPQAQVLPLFYLFPALLALKRWKKPIAMFLTVVTIFLLTFRDSIDNLSKNAQFIPEIPAISQLHNISLSGYAGHWGQVLQRMYRETIPWYWGVFRWLSLTYPRPVHRIINWILVIGILGLGVNIIKLFRKQHLFVTFRLLLFLVFTIAIYTSALVTFDYLFTVSHGFSFGFQGRYFFPVLPAQLMVLFIGIMTLTPDRLKTLFAYCLGIMVIVLHTYAFWFVASSYFDTHSLSAFFIQASQYKPWFFKSPLLELLIIANFVSLVIFLWYYVRIWHETGITDQQERK